MFSSQLIWHIFLSKKTDNEKTPYPYIKWTAVSPSAPEYQAYFSGTIWGAIFIQTGSLSSFFLDTLLRVQSWVHSELCRAEFLTSYPKDIPEHDPWCTDIFSLCVPTCSHGTRSSHLGMEPVLPHPHSLGPSRGGALLIPFRSKGPGTAHLGPAPLLCPDCGCLFPGGPEVLAVSLWCQQISLQRTETPPGRRGGHPVEDLQNGKKKTWTMRLNRLLFLHPGRKEKLHLLRSWTQRGTLVLCLSFSPQSWCHHHCHHQWANSHNVFTHTVLLAAHINQEIFTYACHLRDLGCIILHLGQWAVLPVPQTGHKVKFSGYLCIA